MFRPSMKMGAGLLMVAIVLIFVDAVNDLWHMLPEFVMPAIHLSGAICFGTGLCVMTICGIEKYLRL